MHVDSLLPRACFVRSVFFGRMAGRVCIQLRLQLIDLVLMVGLLQFCVLVILLRQRGGELGRLTVQLLLQGDERRTLLQILGRAFGGVLALDALGLLLLPVIL